MENNMKPINVEDGFYDKCLAVGYLCKDSSKPVRLAIVKLKGSLKLDIRKFTSDGKALKGIVLSNEEVKELASMLSGMVSDNDSPLSKLINEEDIDFSKYDDKENSTDE